MSSATHTQTPVKQRLLGDPRRAKIVVVAAVTALAALLVTLALVLSGGDPPPAGTKQPAAHATHQPSAPFGPSSVAQGQRHVTPSTGSPSTTVPSNPPSGIRYDGGPEEGALGTVPAPPTTSSRYDGGPEEGTRGPVTDHGKNADGSAYGQLSRSGALSDGHPTERYDGGPEEGTRGVGR